jgi:rhamnose transport system ATP-binding protein
MSDTILAVLGVCKAFLGTQALRNVTLEILPGQVHAVCGENGAGKSTLMRVLIGAEQPDTGELHFDGRKVTITDPAHARALGITMIHQELRLTPQLSVGENVHAGRLPRRAGLFVDWRRVHAQTDDLLRQLAAPFTSRSTVADLSIAQRQLVEIAKSLATSSRLVIMDEPTASLTPVETKFLLDIVARLRDEGVAVLYISHRLEEVFEIADTVTVLRDGALVSTRPVAETDAATVVREMIGRQVNLAVEPASPAQHTPRLSVQSLTFAGAFRDVSLQAAAGEIVGIYGLIGAGRTELARALAGLDRYESGTVELDGTALTEDRPWARIREGIAYASEDRKAVGLVLGHSLQDNIALAGSVGARSVTLTSRRRQRSDAASYVDLLHIRPTDVTRPVRLLSGGNQQKVVLAKCLAAGASVLILDEPTRGIDIGAKDEIYRLVRDLAEHGRTILYISSELLEMLHLPHRVLVMRAGRIVADVPRAQVTEELLMRHATGISAAAAAKATSAGMAKAAIDAARTADDGVNP